MHKIDVIVFNRLYRYRLYKYGNVIKIYYFILIHLISRNDNNLIYYFILQITIPVK